MRSLGERAPRGASTGLSAWALLAVSTLLPAIVFALAGWQSRREVLREAGARVEQTITVLHEHALKVFETHRLVIGQVNERLRGFDDTALAETESMYSLLKSLQESLDQVATITVTDAAGRMRASSRVYPVTPAVSFADRDWFVTLRSDQVARPYVSRSYTGRQSGQAVFNVANRVVPPPGAAADTFAGVVAVSVDRSYFETFYRQIEAQSDHAVSLVRADGAVLAHDPPTSVQFLGQASPMLAAMSAADTRAVEASSGLDGVERIVAYRRVGDYPVFVGYGVGKAAALAPWRQQLLGYGITAALASLTLLGASGLAIRQTRREARAREALALAQAELRRTNATLEETVAARTHELRGQTQRLEVLNRTGAALSSELDVTRLGQAAVEAATELAGAAYGALFERVPAGREGNDADVWRLLSLTGAPVEAFTGSGLPWATNLLGPISRAEGVVRADDLLTDPRYGSLGGMPLGHLPVRSYLAVPVTSRSGETLGALLFGHPEPAHFGDREEQLIAGLAGQAAAALDNATLFAAVRREQERFGAAVQAVRGVLWTNDAAGRMRPPQAGWAALTGQLPAEYEGYGWANAVHPDDRAPSVAEWERCVAARRPFVFEHRVRRHDGAWRAFAIRAVPALDPDGAIREWVGVHTDITEQREAEAELRESNEELQRYAYIVSHDLRAPLVNVMGFTSEIEAAREDLRAALGPHPRAQQIDLELGEAIGFIKASVSKMDGLIAAILKLSREGRRVMAPEPLVVTPLVQALADAIRHQTTSADAVIEVAPDLPDLVADRLSVQQVFGNLLDNAVKYLAQGRPGRISVTGEGSGSRVTYHVTDNGRGIAEGDLARVFELFRRAGAQDRPGDGIGLAQVRATVRALGGRIDLSSRLGEGSTFTVSLPRSAARAPEPRSTAA